MFPQIAITTQTPVQKVLITEAACSPLYTFRTAVCLPSEAGGLHPESAFQMTKGCRNNIRRLSVRPFPVFCLKKIQSLCIICISLPIQRAIIKHRQYRIIWQERFARIFCLRMRRVFAAILDVLQESATKSGGKISAKRRRHNCAVLPIQMGERK